MKKQTINILLLLVAATGIFSCGNNLGYKKTKSGLLYKIFSTSKDSVAKEGNVLKLDYVQKINDSVLMSSYGKMAAFARVNKVPEDAYNPAEVFGMLKDGDSVVVVQLVDSLLKKNPMGQLPPFLKKGDKIMTTFHVVKLFRSDADAKIDNAKEIKAEQEREEKQSAIDISKGTKEMEDYLAKNKITAQKIGKGTYVVVKEEGTGDKVDSGKYVTVRYRGIKLADGKVFETNMESGKDPAVFPIGIHQVIQGWDEGLQVFKKGGKGTLYIPGALAYGNTPPQGSPFKPNEALIFDVEILDVSATPPAPKVSPQIEQLQRMQQMQQQQQQNTPKH